MEPNLTAVVAEDADLELLHTLLGEYLSPGKGEPPEGGRAARLCARVEAARLQLRAREQWDSARARAELVESLLGSVHLKSFTRNVITVTVADVPLTLNGPTPTQCKALTDFFRKNKGVPLAFEAGSILARVRSAEKECEALRAKVAELESCPPPVDLKPFLDRLQDEVREVSVVLDKADIPPGSLADRVIAFGIQARRS